ncbi:hypothetical protein TOPH_01690, partial [Tolypocladium ophioglossoides CBS 100239]
RCSFCTSIWSCTSENSRPKLNFAPQTSRPKPPQAHARLLRHGSRRDSLRRRPRHRPGPRHQARPGPGHARPRRLRHLLPHGQGRRRTGRKGPRPREAPQQAHRSGACGRRAADCVRGAARRRAARDPARRGQRGARARGAPHAQASHRRDSAGRQHGAADGVAGRHPRAGLARHGEGQGQDVRVVQAGRRRARASDFAGRPGQLLSFDRVQRAGRHHGHERGWQRHGPRQLEGIQGPRDGCERVEEGREAELSELYPTSKPPQWHVRRLAALQRPHSRNPGYRPALAECNALMGTTLDRMDMYRCFAASPRRNSARLRKREGAATGNCQQPRQLPRKHSTWCLAAVTKCGKHITKHQTPAGTRAADAAAHRGTSHYSVDDTLPTLGDAMELVQ